MNDSRFIFIGAGMWRAHFNLEVKSPWPDIDRLVEVFKAPCPFTKGKLLKETHMVIYFPEISAHNLNLNWWREKMNFTGSGCWEKSNVTEALSPTPGWHLMYKGVVPNFNHKTWQEQLDNLPKPYRVAKGCEAVTLHAFCCRLNGSCGCKEDLNSCSMIGRTAESGLGIKMCIGGCRKDELPIFSCFLDERKSEQISIFAIRPL